MILIKSAATLARHLNLARKEGKSIGFVPTMGALHQGHLSLLAAAGTGNDLVVCSIFVNPTQFNDKRDFEQYPITIEKDIELLEAAGAAILFLPSLAEIYPSGTGLLPFYALGRLETVLEGHYRAGHFQGVCQVMHQLLKIVQANDLYMGQKDYQQCMVVQKLIQLTGSQTVLHPCPTLREPDGLAMSSRNMRLDEQARKKAAIISQTLTQVVSRLQPGDTGQITSWAEQVLSENGFKPDYVAIAAADDLELISHWDGQRKLIVLAAAYLGEIRLIDNMFIPVINSR
jgi:pantoate--beta-alanine ligase